MKSFLKIISKLAKILIFEEFGPLLCETLNFLGQNTYDFVDNKKPEMGIMLKFHLNSIFKSHIKSENRV
jgi:hypothetical protein